MEGKRNWPSMFVRKEDLKVGDVFEGAVLQYLKGRYGPQVEIVTTEGERKVFPQWKALKPLLGVKEGAMVRLEFLGEKKLEGGYSSLMFNIKMLEVQASVS